MVVICDKPCINADGTPYEVEYDGKQLSEFQKWAIKAIKEKQHVLITAHTGSGKTLPAEFAIQYFTSNEKEKEYSKRKKVIYASPIKALSNQKLYDFRRKFPLVSFGIMTGDCKDNPDADVLIMTTEILRNLLRSFTSYKPNEDISGAQQPNKDLYNFEDLAAVVFDEVHYINDPERGAVWEQAILLLPPQVQLIMLSATIDRPEEFAGWIESEKQKQMEKQIPLCLGAAENNSGWGLKEAAAPLVYLASTHTRVVPLTHYMWLSMPSKTYKYAKDTPIERKLPDLHNKPIVIAESNGVYNERNYYKAKEVVDFMRQNDIFGKRQHIMDELLRYLKTNEMLPAICFIFSRKQVERTAKEISFSLFEENSPLPALVEQECRHILSSKLPNYLEYMDLQEYKEIVSLLQKGIAIHHAGIIPVLREMVELLFEKGFIKLLIATETFAVGLNMPTKTVIFLGLSKYNGSTMRLLFPHEYTQMAGRAGRRGIDTIGHVIHCVNLFEIPLCSEYKNMLTGPPQTLVSKFKISFTMALSMLADNKDILYFMEQSLLSSDIRKEIKGYTNNEANVLALVEKKKELLSLGRTPLNVLTKYKTLSENVLHLANSARKKVRIEMNSLEAEYKFIQADLTKLHSLDETMNEYSRVVKDKENTLHYIENTIDIIQKLLLRHGFLMMEISPLATTHVLQVTEKGKIASILQEVHPLAMSDLYENTNGFKDLHASYLAALFSCFYPVSVGDDVKVHSIHSSDLVLSNTVLHLDLLLNTYKKEECDAFLDSGSQYELQYDLASYVLRWCLTSEEIECKIVIQELKERTGIFLGEFIKALLKVNAVALEMEKVCELTQNIGLLEKLREIPHLTLKYIATNQSLYL